MKINKVPFPKTSILSGSDYHYIDSYSGSFIDKNNTVSSKELVIAFFMAAPEWVGILFTLRNKIVSVFGLKTGKKSKDFQSILENFEGKKGESIGLFKVFDRTENELILGEDDTHLDFRISFLLEPRSDIEKNITISTTVIFNNWMGRLYFMPVKPFHKVIVKKMLRNIIKQVSNL